MSRTTFPSAGLSRKNLRIKIWAAPIFLYLVFQSFRGYMSSFREGTTSQAAMKAQECLSSFPIRGDRCFSTPLRTNGTSCPNLRAFSTTPRSTKDTPELQFSFGLQPVVYGTLNSHNELLSFFLMGLTRVMSFHACISATKRRILNWDEGFF